VPASLTEAPAKIHILVGGDLMPHRPMLEDPSRLGDALEPLGPLFAGADLAVANYEAATGDPAAMGAHDISLVATSEWMRAASRYFHAVTVANNHACDLGRRGLESTLEAAREAHVTALGGDDRSPWQPRVLVEKEGRRVCAVAWTTFVNSEAHACPGSGKLAMAGYDSAGMHAIARAVSSARASGCDATVAIFHGGTEYEAQTPSALALAHVAAEAGADAVVIHHPHVPSPVSVYTTRDGRSVPVFASVGNLVSNQGESYRPEFRPVSPEHYVSLNAWTRLGVIADLEWSWPVETSTDTRPSLAYGYHLTWTENEHATNRAEPRPRITVRPLDPALDRSLIGRLETDPDGPTRLFDDPCWLERGVTRCAFDPRPVSRYLTEEPCPTPLPARSASSSPSPASTVTIVAQRSSRGRCATPASRSSTPGSTRRPR
jgi:Bacterial capsule synthesis protein PGA_cap